MKKGIVLNQGQAISLSALTKSNIIKSDLTKVMVGLGWDPVKKVEEKIERNGLFGLKKTRFVKYNEDIDCDSFALLLHNGKATQTSDLIYFGQLNHPSGYAYHSGDNLTGIGDGDDECIYIDLEHIECDSIILGVVMYDAVLRNQHMGLLKNAFIRLVDDKTKTEICKFSLNHQYSGFYSMILGELVKQDGQWGFIAVGTPIMAESITDIARMYGMPNNYRTF